MRNTIIDYITSKAKSDPNIFLVVGDAGFGVVNNYQSLYPNRFLNLGIAEQNMISFSAGLALTGFKVFAYNLIPFLLYRPYEQVRNDICYQKLPITLIGIGSGVTYSPHGVTHYSVEDIAIAKTMPNLTILSPADKTEATECIKFAISSPNPTYIRIAKNSDLSIHKTTPNIELPIVIKPGKKVAVLFHGSIAEEVIKAGENTNVMLISMPMLNPINFKELLKSLKNIHTIITVEEHFKDGGLGSIISNWIVKEQLSFKLIKLGITNEFIHAIKSTEGMRDLYGISAGKIRKVIEREMK